MQIAGFDVCNGGPLPGRGDLATFEEHRYDALGRRILTRNRSWVSCVGPNCDDVIQRTVWDGDQILAEFRYQGYDGAADSTLERDAGVVDLSTGHWEPFSCETQISPPPEQDPNCTWVTAPQTVFPFGQVIYTHGAGLDAPLAVQRRFYSAGKIDQTVIPITNWRGDVTASADEQGRHLDCTLQNTWASCLTVEWPGER